MFTGLPIRRGWSPKVDPTETYFQPR